MGTRWSRGRVQRAAAIVVACLAGSITPAARADDTPMRQTACAAAVAGDGCSAVMPDRESFGRIADVAPGPGERDVYIAMRSDVLYVNGAPYFHGADGLVWMRVVDGQPRFAGCWSSQPVDGCERLGEREAAGARSVVLSADGRDLYLGSAGRVLHFTLGADGRPAPQDCVELSGLGSCVGGDVEGFGAQLALAPDGRDLYGFDGGLLVHLIRHADGSLAREACAQAGMCASLEAPCGEVGRPEWCWSNPDGDGGIAITRDGRTVVTAAGALASYQRLADGTLLPIGCVQARAEQCATPDPAVFGERPFQQVAAAPDGSIFATGYYNGDVLGGAVSHFRVTDDSRLAFDGCAGVDTPGCHPLPDGLQPFATTYPPLSVPRSLAVLPDGELLQARRALHRWAPAAGGAMTAQGCIGDAPHCEPGLVDMWRGAVSPTPDGHAVWVAGEDHIARFDLTGTQGRGEGDTPSVWVEVEGSGSGTSPKLHGNGHGLRTTWWFELEGADGRHFAFSPTVGGEDNDGYVGSGRIDMLEGGSWRVRAVGRNAAGEQVSGWADFELPMRGDVAPDVGYGGGILRTTSIAYWFDALAGMEDGGDATMDVTPEAGGTTRTFHAPTATARAPGSHRVLVVATGLLPATRYRVRIAASNRFGTKVLYDDALWTTAAAEPLARMPVAIAQRATPLQGGRLRLEGTATGGSAGGTLVLQRGSGDAVTTTDLQALPAGGAAGPVTDEVAAPAPGSTLRWRFAVRARGAIADGPWRQWTAPPAAPAPPAPPAVEPAPGEPAPVVVAPLATAEGSLPAETTATAPEPVTALGALPGSEARPVAPGPRPVATCRPEISATARGGAAPGLVVRYRVCRTGRVTVTVRHPGRGGWRAAATPQVLAGRLQVLVVTLPRRPRGAMVLGLRGAGASLRRTVRL